MQSRTFINLLSWTLFLCLFSACSSTVKIVESDQDKDVNLKSYKTFDFVDMNVNNQTDLEPEQENLRILLDEITKAMEARNYKRAANPDLLINLGIVITEEVQTRETDIRDAPMYLGQRNYSWQSEEVVIGTYNQGSVALDMVDAQRKALVFRVVARSVLSKKREKNVEKIKEAVEKMFKKFPS